MKMQMNQAGNDWIDVTVPLSSGMVHWPGDPEPSFERISDMDQGAVANVTMCRMTAHSGTHMDAPCHFLAGREGMETFPLAVGIGKARIVSIPDAAIVGEADLADKGIRRGERILLRTRNSAQAWERREFQTDFTAIDASGARFLVDAGVALIGVDYLSVGAYDGDGVATHQILLGGGVWILEGLNLRGLADGNYEMICLPMKIAGSDGAPARVVLRKAEY